MVTSSSWPCSCPALCLPCTPGTPRQGQIWVPLDLVLRPWEPGRGQEGRCSQVPPQRQRKGEEAQGKGHGLAAPSTCDLKGALPFLSPGSDGISLSGGGGLQGYPGREAWRTPIPWTPP